MKTKLTLRLDEDLIRQAKRRGTSVSQMVADYIALLNEEPDADDETPHSAFTQSLLGVATNTDVGAGPKDHRDAYYEHVEEKHR